MHTTQLQVFLSDLSMILNSRFRRNYYPNSSHISILRADWEEYGGLRQNRPRGTMGRLGRVYCGYGYMGECSTTVRNLTQTAQDVDEACPFPKNCIVTYANIPHSFSYSDYAPDKQQRTHI